MKPQAIQFLFSGAMLASLVFIPLYASEVLGLNKVEIAAMAFAYSFMVFGSSYIFGRYSDIYGRNLLLLVGLFAAGASFYLQAITWNFWSLFVVRCLVGLSLGLFPAALLAYAHETKWKMGRFTSWGALGWGVVTAIAGFIIFFFEIRFVFVFASVLTFFGFLIAMFLPKRDVPVQRIPFFPKELFTRNMHYYIPYLLRHTTACAIWVFWPLILIEVGAGPIGIGLVLLVNGLTQFIIMFFLSDKFDTNKAFVFGLFMSAITFGTIYLAFIFKNFPFMLLTQVALGISWACMYASTVRFLLENNKEKASATGLMNSTISISSILGPLLALIIVSLNGTYSTLLITSIVGAVLGIIVFAILRGAKSVTATKVS